MAMRNHLERLHPEQAHTSINFQESFLAPGNCHRSIIASRKGMCPYIFFMEHENLNTINFGKVRLSWAQDSYKILDFSVQLMMIMIFFVGLKIESWKRP